MALGVTKFATSGKGKIGAFLKITSLLLASNGLTRALTAGTDIKRAKMYERKANEQLAAEMKSRGWKGGRNKKMNFTMQNSIKALNKHSFRGKSNAVIASDINDQRKICR